MEVAPAIVHPLLLQISGSDGDLSFAGADRGVEVDPVGIEGAAVVLACGDVVDLRQPPHLLQAMLVARAVIGQLNRWRISDVRQIAVVEEASVMHDVGVRLRILESRIVILQREIKLNSAMRQYRRGKLVKIKADGWIFDEGGLASDEAELLDQIGRPGQRRDIRRPESHGDAVDVRDRK